MGVPWTHENPYWVSPSHQGEDRVGSQLVCCLATQAGPSWTILSVPTSPLHPPPRPARSSCFLFLSFFLFFFKVFLSCWIDQSIFNGPLFPLRDDKFSQGWNWHIEIQTLGALWGSPKPLPSLSWLVSPHTMGASFYFWTRKKHHNERCKTRLPEQLLRGQVTLFIISGESVPHRVDIYRQEMGDRSEQGG